MLPADIMIFLGIVLLEILVLVLCGITYRYNRTRGLRLAVLLFMLVQAIGVSSFMLGKEWESGKHGFVHILQQLFPDSSVVSPPFKILGDPGLIGYASQDSGKNVRPQFDSRNNFTDWQNSKRQLLQDIFNFKPHANIASVTVKQYGPKEDLGTVTRSFISMESFDGTSVPGYLLIPRKSLPVPGIIVLPGHVLENDEGILQTAGLISSYQRQAGLELAKAGYVVLTIEFRGFGKLGKAVSTEHRLVAYNALLGGSFYKAILSQDISLALEYLRSLQEVDSQRIGITGVSYGGEMALTYASLDPRIKAVVFQGYGGRVGPLSGRKGRKEDQPHYCHFIPGFQQYFFQEDLAFLVAPRPLLGVRGTKEGNYKKSDFEIEVSKAYKVLNDPPAFQIKKMKGAHEYFVQPAVEFFDKYL